MRRQSPSIDESLNALMTSPEEENNSSMDSLPEEFSKPLARSSVLPVPESVFSTVGERLTSRFLPVPKELLQPNKEGEVIVLDESDDDDVIESSNERTPKDKLKAVIEESDTSSVLETSVQSVAQPEPIVVQSDNESDQSLKINNESDDSDADASPIVQRRNMQKFRVVDESNSSSVLETSVQSVAQPEPIVVHSDNESDQSLKINNESDDSDADASPIFHRRNMQKFRVVDESSSSSKNSGGESSPSLEQTSSPTSSSEEPEKVINESDYAEESYHSTESGVEQKNKSESDYGEKSPTASAVNLVDENDTSPSTSHQSTTSTDSSNSSHDSMRQLTPTASAVNLVDENDTSPSTSHQSTTDSSNSSYDSMRQLKRQIEEKSIVLRNLEYARKNCDPRKLKDGGRLLQEKLERCRCELTNLQKQYKIAVAEHSNNDDDIQIVETVKKDIIFSTRDQKTAHLGEKALQTHRIEKALTMDALVSLHSSLATTPATDTFESDPKHLKVPLMPHQRQALAWLLHREKQNPAGGILADDMGLGKTLTMIALVLRASELKADGDKENRGMEWKSTQKKHPGKTLVVCPASLIGQWESQVKQHVNRGRLSTILHHGSNREGRGSKLVDADLVITTYGVLAQENKDKVAIFRVAWERVILDEAHQIRNHKTQSAVAACELEAKYRWCLTGTPVHNKELDIYSLLKFLRCAPFDDLVVWKRWVDNKTAAGTERLNTVVKSILLRRTKEELKSQGKLGDLSTKKIHNVQVELDEQEFRVYENIMKFSQTLVARYLQERAEKTDGGGLMAPRIKQIQNMMHKMEDIKTHDILVLLLRLRQICCLPGLISAMLEEDATAADGFEKEDAAVEDLFKQVRRLTISAPPIEEEQPKVNLDKVLLTSNPVFNLERPSSKMQIVLKTIKEILKTGEKVVIVSQWSSFLRHLSVHLKSLDFKIATLDGSLPVKARGPLVEEFNDPGSKLRVLLLSLTAGGVGLNLIGGNHLVIMEPHWNPQLESQACDRVYRVGQKKPVHIYKVICKDTIEEQIEILQQKKLALAENVLTGQLKKEVSKLSLQDLKSLFGL